MVNKLISPSELVQAAIAGFFIPVSATCLLGVLHYSSWGDPTTPVPTSPFAGVPSPDTGMQEVWTPDTLNNVLTTLNGRPQVFPLPDSEEVWECDVIVVGGSLGGVSAASQSMQSGATTCLIEVTPWLGGQISSQGVSALDESVSMRRAQNFSQSWQAFRRLILQQWVELPAWAGVSSPVQVVNINSCWVGFLCFPPQAGAIAAEQWLETAAQNAPASRWSTSTAFKGAEFDPTGQRITAIYAVQRISRDPNYQPKGRLSQELPDWYSWSETDEFDKVPIRLQAPPGRSLIVIDATDTGEVIAWSRVPYRLGSEAKTTTGEVNGSVQDNPQCTQAFTYPFAMAIHDDGGAGLSVLSNVKSDYGKAEHAKYFDLEGHPMFQGGSLFNYRRIVSTILNDANHGTPVYGDITMVNWNRGNDMGWMNPPLILTDEELAASGQFQNWMGGVSLSALENGEARALFFSEWLIQTQSNESFPLAHLFGAESPMGTQSGLSMAPYIREGRRILGRNAYGEDALMIKEFDIRMDMEGGRDFSPTLVALTHYDVDMHGCSYRNGEPSLEAQSAPSREWSVRPVQIPLESLIPQGVDNLLVGGKSLAVSHIVNAVTRTHYNEWSIGGAAGATAGWLVAQNESQTDQPALMPPDILLLGLIPDVQQHLLDQGLRLDW